MRISVVLAVYNAEKTLMNTIQSLLSQTVIDYEIIIVDAGSTDATYEVCDSYLALSRRVKVMRIAQQGNMAMARNTGISMAQGQYIFFANAKYVYESYTLERLMYAMHIRKMDWALAYYGDDNQIQEWEIKFPAGYKIETEQTRKWFVEKFPQSFITSVYNKMYRADILREQGIHFLNSEIMSETFFQLRYMQHVHKLAIVGSTIFHEKPKDEVVYPDMYDWDMVKKGTIEYYRLAEQWGGFIPENPLLIRYFLTMLVRHLGRMVAEQKGLNRKSRQEYYERFLDDPWVDVMLSKLEVTTGMNRTVLGMLKTGQFTAMEGILLADNQVKGYGADFKQMLQHFRSGI